MILRKPYGFLIKHFRLIHLIITSILVFIVYYSNNIYSFFNKCIKDSFFKQDALSYINNGVFLWIFILIILFVIVYLLLKYKGKPRKLYLYSICGYLIVGIYLYIVFNYMNQLPGGIIDQKTIRGYRDITLVVLIYQYLMIIIMFVRGLGFNIRKFNFDKDMHDLNLSKEDNEEVEVNLNINTTDIMRNVRKQKRELGYYFQEYKIIILGILSIVLVCFVWRFSSYFKGIFSFYKEGQVVGNINYITVKDSYYDVSTDNDYIIVKFDIFKYGKKELFNIDSMVLIAGKNKYYPNKNICNNFNKLGNCYKKQYITSDSKTYIVAYKVEGINSNKSYILYNEDYENSYKIKLDLENYE